MQSRLVEAYGNCGEAGGTLFDFDLNVIFTISNICFSFEYNIKTLITSMYRMGIAAPFFYLLKAFEE